MIAIPGYILTAPLCDVGDLLLYQAIRTVDGLPVLLKFPANPRPSSSILRRLEHEYELTRNLDPGRVIHPIALERHTNTMTLILEHGPDRTLESLLGSPMAIHSFLQIAIGITTALAELHRNELLHKDIKPEHLLLDAAGHVWLTGLGIASRLPRERQAPEPPETIVGTLAYMAPEQTGRMNRSIDSRSDLYSLGIIFYRMLTGVLPFIADDPMAWVHCHIARQAVPPSQLVPDLPEPLSAMVMKLMAKTAEDRYQSATGLGNDLRRCLAQWESQWTIDPFPLGADDVPDRLLIPENMYGRKQEIDILLAAYDRVAASSRPELVLVSGYSGVGKSAVVNELHKALVSSRALFAGGKFDQFKRDIPYATLAQALQTLVRHVLGKSEGEIAGWREAILEAVGPNGQLVTQLVPDLVALIGEQHLVQDVPPQDAQNRFNTVFSRFLNVFASPERPLVLFLDDLQWIDTATLQLLDHLLIHPVVKDILLLGAYRDNEVSISHPLMLALDSMQKAGAAVQSIVLGPLMKEDVLRLTADAFHCKDAHAEPLAALLYEKTGGNPFFTVQFLTMLADERLVAFDRDTACWQWDLGRIHGKGFTDNVADLMIGKLNRLQPETREGLKQLACLGSKTRLATLALVWNRTEEEVEKDLLGAMQTGLLLRQDYSVFFLHDRVLEAAYALIPEEDRPKVHLSIGRRLLAHAGPEELGDILFDVTNHLNRGAGLITDPAEKVQLAELNAATGRRARASIAYAAARDYFAAAAPLLPEDTWRSRYDFTFALYLDWAECEYLRGAFQEVEPLFDLLLAQAGSALDQTRVYDLQMTLYQVAGRFDDALAAGLRALQLFGVDIPEDDQGINQAIMAEAAAAAEYWRGSRISELATVPSMLDPGINAVVTLLASSAPSAYIGSRPQLFPLLMLKGVNYSLRFGPVKSSCHAYAAYGFMLASAFGDPHNGYAFSDMAIKLSERFNDLGVIGAVHYLHGNHVNFWLNPIATDFPVLDRGFRACQDSGNLVFANYIAYSIVWQAVERGDTLGDALEFSGKYAAFALGSRNDATYQSIILEQQFLKCLMGNTDGSTSFSDAAVSELVCVEKIATASFTCGVMYYHTMKTLVAYVMGDDAAALTHAEEAGKMLAAAMGQPMEAMFYFLQALVLARDYCKASDGGREKILSTLTVCQKKLAFWAENCPANFAAKHALISAEIASVTGDVLSAEQLYEQAIQSAQDNRYIHWEAMANEAAGHFYRERGYDSIATMYLRQAHYCYLRWGAVVKIRQLDTQFPYLVDHTSSSSSMILGTETASLDVLAVVAASQALSGEILQDKLLKTLMQIVLENAGAQQGQLLLIREEELLPAAEAHVENQSVVVQLHCDSILPEGIFPASIVNYVRRSRDKVLLDDATASNPYAADDYFSRQHPKSVLCFPIIKQNRLIGLFYLENDLATHAFTPDRLVVLELLAAQTAISLENARLYAEQEYNITELKQAKESISASNERFRSVLRATTAYSIIGTDPDGLITVFNEGAELMLGYCADEVINKITPALFHDPDEIAVHAAKIGIEPGFEVFVSVARKGEMETHEWTYIRKDGSRIAVSMTVTAMRNETGELSGFIGVAQDITELKRNVKMLHLQAIELEQEVAERQFAQEELQQLNKELEQRVLSRTAELSDKNAELQSAYDELKVAQARLLQQDKMASIGQLAAGVAHEINNPMGFISSNLTSLGKYMDKLTAYMDAGEQLITGASPEIAASLAEQRKSLKIDRIRQDLPELISESHDGAERVRKIVQELKAFSHVDRAQQSNADLNEGLESTLAIVWNELKYKATVIKEYGDLPRITCNPGQINQVFMNLLVNAVQAIEQRGEIRIRSWEEDSRVMIAIGDTGCGIPKDVCKHIFDPFFTTKEVGKGTGLGLAIAYDIVVNKHGGSIDVRSEVGKGSTFTITLPLENKNRPDEGGTLHE